MRVRDGHGAEAGAGPTRRPSGPRPRLVRLAAAGASTVEYGLLIALIAAVLCIGLGVTLQTVFGDAVQCFLAGLQGNTPTNCSPNTGSGGAGGGGAGTGGGGGAGVPVSPSPTVTPTPTP